VAKKLKMLTKCAAPPSTNTMPDQPLKHSSSPLAHMPMKEVATSNELVRSSPMRYEHILENKSKHMPPILCHRTERLQSRRLVCAVATLMLATYHLRSVEAAAQEDFYFSRPSILEGDYEIDNVDAEQTLFDGRRKRLSTHRSKHGEVAVSLHEGEDETDEAIEPQVPENKSTGDLSLSRMLGNPKKQTTKDGISNNSSGVLKKERKKVAIQKKSPGGNGRGKVTKIEQKEGNKYAASTNKKALQKIEKNGNEPGVGKLDKQGQKILLVKKKNSQTLWHPSSGGEWERPGCVCVEWWGDDGWNNEGWESAESNDRWGHNDIKKRNEILSAPEDASPGVGSSASSFAMGFANGGGHRRLNRGVKKKRKIGLGSKSSKTKSLKSKGSKSKGAKSKSSSTSSKKCKKWVCEPTSFP